MTGATGGIGGRVARRLAERDLAQRLIVRDPARAPALANAAVAEASYADGGAMRSALTGVATLLLVSASEAADRMAHHRSAVDAAVAAGVRHIVYVSFLGAAEDATFTLARHHWQTEERIRASGVRYTFLRDSLYLDAFPYWVGSDGALRGPAGDGRVAAVARDDIADAAAQVLVAGREHAGRSYDLTGPEALTLQDVASVMAQACARAITYVPETLAEAYASRAHYGAPDWQVEAWVSTYTAIAAGELNVVSDHVGALTGHPPIGLAEYLVRDPDALARLRPSG